MCIFVFVYCDLKLCACAYMCKNRPSECNWLLILNISCHSLRHKFLVIITNLCLTLFTFLQSYVDVELVAEQHGDSGQHRGGERANHHLVLEIAVIVQKVSQVEKVHPRLPGLCRWLSNHLLTRQNIEQLQHELTHELFKRSFDYLPDSVTHWGYSYHAPKHR